MRGFLIFVVVALAHSLLAFDARAQSKPDLRVWLDTDTIEVGQTAQLTLQATSENDKPHDPELAAASGLVVRLTGEMPTHMSFNFNGVRSEKHSLTVTWQIRAAKTGTYTIGPATIAVGAARYASKPLKLTVVPAGTAPRFDPRGGGGGGGNPFDPFKGFFGPDFDDDPFKALEPRLETDPKLALPTPLGAVAFLHAFVDKKRVVVGEQVTFTVHLYIDAGEREPELRDVHEAPAPDFARKSLQDNDTQAGHVGLAQVGGKVYAVKLLRKSALFPLKAGELDIGSMTLSVAKTRGANGLRSSESLKVVVVDPPLAGRPAGYVVGTVGKMKLAAEVTPRETPAGGAVAVDVELAGTGNLPASLSVPVIAGVEWLEPQIVDKLGRDGDRYGGKRTFSYVLKLHKPGTIDLGHLALPFYDPDTGAYDVARASLGTVLVTPGRDQKADDAAPELLPGLPAARKGLEGDHGARAWLADSPLFWLGLGATPLAWLVAAGARASARRVRARLAARAASPETELKLRTQAADAACKTVGEIGARRATAAIAHALESATIARLGVNVRGVTGSDLAAALRERGLEDGRIEELRELLRECDDVRFSPDDGHADDVVGRWKRARALIDALPRGGA